MDNEFIIGELAMLLVGSQKYKIAVVGYEKPEHYIVVDASDPLKHTQLTVHQDLLKKIEVSQEKPRILDMIGDDF